MRRTRTHRIIRNHIGLITSFSSDVIWGDMAMIWRTNIFIFLYGMTMTMEYDKEEVSTKRLVKNFIPMLPIYFVCLALHVPITISCQNAQYPDSMKPVGMIGAIFLLQSVSPIGWSPMGHAWTLSAIWFFTLLFKPLRRCMQLCRMCDNPEPGSPQSSECCQCACCCCEDPQMSRRPPTKTLGQFVRRLAIWSLYPTLTIVTGGASHFWFPCQLTRFFLGMIVGEGVLHVRMDEATAKTCGRWTDAIAVIIFIISFAFPFDYGAGSGVMAPHSIVAYTFHNFPVAYLIFGLCRSKYSRAAKFFSLEIFTGFTKYTYAAYLLHIPLIHWGQFAQVKGFQSWSDVFNYDYSANACAQPDEDNGLGREWKDVPWPFYISAFCVTIVGAVLLTMFVHEPFQHVWNKHTSNSEARTAVEPAQAEVVGKDAHPHVVEQKVGARMLSGQNTLHHH